MKKCIFVTIFFYKIVKKIREKKVKKTSTTWWLIINHYYARISFRSPICDVIVFKVAWLDFFITYEYKQDLKTFEFIKILTESQINHHCSLHGRAYFSFVLFEFLTSLRIRHKRQVLLCLSTHLKRWYRGVSSI